MKNVLLVAESYSGGVKTYIDTIMKNSNEKSEIRFYALISSSRLEKEEDINKDYLIEDVMSFGKSPLKLLKALYSLHRVIIEHKIEVVHVNSTYAGLLMYIYVIWNKKPYYIYTPHGYYSFKQMGKIKKIVVRLIEKKINKSSNLIIHVSPSEEKEAIKYKLTPASKSIVVLNGSPDPQVDAVRNAKDIFTIVNLARVDDPKNPFEFIEIAKRVLEKNLNVEFIWAGNGKYLEEARERVQIYGLENQVKFIGFSNAKDKILKESDLYLSTSQYEGLPFGVIEAMSYRLPLLLTNIIGHTDMVKDNENGLLFKDKDDKRIYDFLASIINSQEKWDCLSSYSYKIFNDRFNTKQMLEKLLITYQNAKSNN